jgi:transcriptional regulator with XRE-family HTH domain
MTDLLESGPSVPKKPNSISTPKPAPPDRGPGERIKQLRLKNKLSLRELAALVGCSASFLSRIETNKSSPTLRQLARMGAVLGTTVEEFVRPQLPATQALMVRHAFRRRSVLGRWNGVTLQHLLPSDMGQSFSALLLTIEKGGKSGHWCSRREVPELAIVLRGRVRMKLGSAVHELEQSDSICYDISVPHQWTNLESGPTEVVLINTHFTPLEEWPGILDPENQGRS